MSFLSLDLNLLKVFDAIMSEQNLTRAADRLSMTQPAASNALRRLRAALDDELFIRGQHGLKPTTYAELLWPAVRQALTTLEVALTPRQLSASEAHATYRLMMADSAAALLMPPLMHAIRQEAPGLDVRMLPLTTRDPRPLLLQNDIDIAIGSYPGVVLQLNVEQGELSPIRHQQLYSGEYRCIMRKNHPLARGELTLDSYCDALHVLMSVSGRAHGAANVELAKLGRTRRVALTVNQFSTVGRIVAQTDLISIVPQHVIASIGMADVLAVKAVPFELPTVQVDLLWHDRDRRNPSHRWMRETLSVLSNEQSPSGNHTKSLHTMPLSPAP
ncbi:LysR family transcriptional regulator [Massilia putida]|uniref:LysR family transcriptional regulator n=1 Tax=Massilia putida TaxID=1141883 RepID=UPI0009516D88|nr:LysR family transcriptional regulator [Massilia putida]